MAKEKWTCDLHSDDNGMFKFEVDEKEFFAKEEKALICLALLKVCDKLDSVSWYLKNIHEDC